MAQLHIYPDGIETVPEEILNSKYFLYVCTYMHYAGTYLCMQVVEGTVAMPSGGSRRTRQYVQNPEELDSMPTISGGEADGGVGIESSSEGFWTYCLVCLEPPDGIAPI